MSDTARAQPAVTGSRQQPQEPEGKPEATSRRALLRDRSALAVELAVVFAAALVYAVSFGFNYGVNNQVTYLVPSLRVLDGDLYENDWFATQTTHIHPGYKYLGALLIAMNDHGWGIALGLTLVVTLGTACLYWTLRVIAGPRVALPSFLVLVTFMLVTGTRGPAMSYVFDTIFQPSTLGSAAFLASVPFFVRQQFFASGALLALSGVFHANLLILFSGGYAVAHCLLRPRDLRDLRRRLLLQFALPVATLLFFLPMLLSASGGATATEAARARQLVFDVRAPHHFVIGNQERDFIPFIAWHLVSLGMAQGFASGTRGRPAARLVALIVGILAIIWLGVLASAVYRVHQVTVLFPWRVVPHAELLLQTLAVATAVALVLEPGRVRRLGLTSLAMLVSGIGLLCFTSSVHNQPDLSKLVLYLTLFVAGVLAVSAVASRIGRLPLARFTELWGRHAPLIVTIGGVFLLYDVALGPLRSIPQRSNAFSGLPRAESALYAWMQGTPKGAVFLTPPYVETMRLHGKRAIVVDWKSSPASPSEIFEWYRRLQDVTGRPNLRSVEDLVGYDLLDAGRLEMLRTRYKIDYAVVRRGHEKRLLQYRPCYENAGFVVIELTPRS